MAVFCNPVQSKSKWGWIYHGRNMRVSWLDPDLGWVSSRCPLEIMGLKWKVINRSCPISQSQQIITSSPNLTFKMSWFSTGKPLQHWLEVGCRWIVRSFIAGSWHIGITWTQDAASLAMTQTAFVDRLLMDAVSRREDDVFVCFKVWHVWFLYFNIAPNHIHSQVS